MIGPYVFGSWNFLSFIVKKRGGRRKREGWKFFSIKSFDIVSNQKKNKDGAVHIVLLYFLHYDKYCIFEMISAICKEDQKRIRCLELRPYSHPFRSDLPSRRHFLSSSHPPPPPSFKGSLCNL